MAKPRANGGARTNAPDKPKARSSAHGAQHLHLRLFVAGSAPNSLLAIANAKEICAEFFDGVHDLEIVDMLTHPERGVDDGIVVTPTLVMLSPPPVRRVIGTLADRVRTLLVLRGV